MAQRRSIRGQEIRIEGSPIDRHGVKAQPVVSPGSQSGTCASCLRSADHPSWLRPSVRRCIQAGRSAVEALAFTLECYDCYGGVP